MYYMRQPTRRLTRRAPMITVLCHCLPASGVSNPDHEESEYSQMPDAVVLDGKYKTYTTRYNTNHYSYPHNDVFHPTYTVFENQQDSDTILTDRYRTSRSGQTPGGPRPPYFHPPPTNTEVVVFAETTQCRHCYPAPPQPPTLPT